MISLVVSQGETTASALAVVRCVDVKKRGRLQDGIPKPVLIDAPGATWRSRMEGDVWQVNAGHEDYLALEDGRARLRYLVALLGKEIVQRTYAQPGAGDLLEHLVASWRTPSATCGPCERNVMMASKNANTGQSRPPLCTQCSGRRAAMLGT